MVDMHRAVQVTIHCVVVTASLLPVCALANELELKRIYPCYGQRNSTVEVTLAGSGLEKARALYFASPGISAEKIDQGRFRISVSPEASLGDCDVWVATADGLAGPRRFEVDDLPGAVEKESNESAETAQKISLPVALCAKLDHAADVDWFAFHGESGQRVTISCRSLSLDGSVEPALILVGPDGQELLHSRDGRREPSFHVRLPQSGEYRLRVCDRAYRTDDFSFYRLVLVTGPHLTHAFPQVLAKGMTRRVSLYGYDLPGGKPIGRGGSGVQEMTVDVTAPAEGDPNGRSPLASTAVRLEGFRFRRQGLSGSVQFGLTDNPLVVESEEDNGPDAAQTIELPCHVVGRFLTRGDVDWFRFAVRKGQTLRIDSIGQRSGQLMDLDVAVSDANGKLLTTLPDMTAAKGASARLPLASLDAAAEWKSPSDGEFLLMIRDLYDGSVFGLDRVYELAIGPTQPASHVVAMQADDNTPRGWSVEQGGQAALQLIAVRSGGFAGPIRVHAESLPPGVAAEHCTIDGKQNEKPIIIKALDDAPTGVFPVSLIAEAEVKSQNVSLPVCGVTVVSRGAAQTTRRTDGILIHIRERQDEK